MGGFLAGTPNSNVAQMYRGACTPLPAEDDRRRAQRDDWHHALVALWLPFVVVAATIGGLIYLGTQTTDASSSVSPMLRVAMIVVAGASLLIAALLWKRVWYIDDMATIEVAAAHPGACEFVGRVRTGTPATAWFSGLPVIWWSAEIIETRANQNGQTERKTIWDESGGHKTFWLDDGTAMVKVDARGAGGGGARRTVDRTIGNYRIIEHALVVDQQVFLTGPVQIDDDALLCVRRPRNELETGHGAPYWISFSENRLRSSFRGVAVLATVLSLVLAAAASLWTTVPSTLEAHLGKDTLVLRETSLLVPVAIIAAGVALVHLLHYGIGLYNRLVTLKHRAAFAFSTIDIAAARRHDLIGSMVDVASATSAHERQALVEAIRTRSQLPDDAKVDAVRNSVSADNQMRTMIGRHEAHPDIVSAEAYTTLFENLIDSENRIAASRRFYNDAVTTLADRSGSFPGVVLAPLVVGTIPPLLTIDLGLGEATATGAAVKPSGADLGPVDDLVDFGEFGERNVA